MTNVTPGPKNYAGNSNKDKTEEESSEPRVEKLVEGRVVERKKSLGRRIADNFTGADAQSVGSYVLFDVILPRFKELLFDVGETALRRTLFGDNARGYSPRAGGAVKGWTPYNTMSTGATPKAQVARPASQEPSNEFSEFVVETRGEAQNVMDKMSDLIEKFGMASVSDLKAALGVTSNFTDEKWGWDVMGGTDIRRVGGSQPGYLLIFPAPQDLTA